MPKIIIPFASADVIPNELKGYAGSNNSVEVWAGDKVADETNPGLAANRDALKSEKDALQTKYDGILQSSAAQVTELTTLREIVAKGNQVSAEDVELLNTVKAVRPYVKAKDLKTELEEVPTLRTRVTEIDQNEANSKLFKASGFKNETIFKDLISNKAKNPNLEKTYIQTEKVDGKDIEVAYADIKGTDGKISKMKLGDYVKDNTEWQPYASMLDAASNQTHQWIPQTPASGGGSQQTAVDPIDNFIKQHNEVVEKTPNPLLSNSLYTSRAEAKQN